MLIINDRVRESHCKRTCSSQRYHLQRRIVKRLILQHITAASMETGLNPKPAYSEVVPFSGTKFAYSVISVPLQLTCTEKLYYLVEKTFYKLIISASNEYEINLNYSEILNNEHQFYLI